MRRALVKLLLSVAATSAVRASAQTTTLNGKDFAVRSTGALAGNGWSLSGTGYLGTYVTVPSGGGTVSFTLNALRGATGAGTPHVNLVIADTKLGFDVANTTASNYSASAFLPGGTYFVR